jgi:hypothetical protein
VARTPSSSSSNENGTHEKVCSQHKELPHTQHPQLSKLRNLFLLAGQRRQQRIWDVYPKLFAAFFLSEFVLALFLSEHFAEFHFHISIVKFNFTSISFRFHASNASPA